MIELYYAPTPNCDKVVILLEELGEQYEIRYVDLAKGEQLDHSFLALTPNNKVPVIVDAGPEAARPLFESGAILQYIAEKHGRFLPSQGADRFEVLQWLTWQVAGLGPMAGQAGYFLRYAPDHIPQAIERYTNEVNRLYGVLDRTLSGRKFVAGDYSIADMSIWPWIRPDWHQQDLEGFPNLAAWKQRVAERNAVLRSIEIAAPYLARFPTMNDDVRRVLYNQTAQSIGLGRGQP